jgi:hypothetical protein
MTKLLALCTSISVAITAYCFLEYQLPHAQFTKVLSDLKMSVNDKELIERVRWDILGVQTTWKPLFALTLAQNVLLVILTARSISTDRRKCS